MAGSKNKKSKRGFASMPKSKVKEIASKGGRASRGRGRLSRDNESMPSEDTGGAGGTWSGY